MSSVDDEMGKSDSSSGSMDSFQVGRHNGPLVERFIRDIMDALWMFVSVTF